MELTQITKTTSKYDVSTLIINLIINSKKKA